MALMSVPGEPLAQPSQICFQMELRTPLFTASTQACKQAQAQLA